MIVFYQTRTHIIRFLLCQRLPAIRQLCNIFLSFKNLFSNFHSIRVICLSTRVITLYATMARDIFHLTILSCATVFCHLNFLLQNLRVACKFFKIYGTSLAINYSQLYSRARKPFSHVSSTSIVHSIHRPILFYLCA